MTSDIEEVLSALNEAGVRYLIVGGVAVVLHGHLRTTVNLDLVIELVPQNASNAMAALEALGFAPRAPVEMADFADQATRSTWKEQKGLTVFSLFHPNKALEIDLFVEEPFDFDEVYARSKNVHLTAIDAQVIAIEDLIALKKEAGRPQDLADIEKLRQIQADEEN